MGNFSRSNKLVQCLVFICLHLKLSSQDLYKLSLERGLNLEEIELSKNIDLNRFTRMSNEDAYVTTSGIRQSAECGKNSHSSFRKRRQDFPQGKEDWPWMAVFLEKARKNQFCGGALLNRQYILTAAHCFVEPGAMKTMDQVLVRLGEWNLQEENETQIKDFNVADIKPHTDYDPATKRNDIALVKLDRKVDYSHYIRPICLPNSIPPTNETLVVAGWGATKSRSTELSPILLDVYIPLWDYDLCTDLHASSSSISKESNICAAGYELGKDSCTGDSGGPLFYQDSTKGNRWVTIGIVSWGMNCGDFPPGIYTSVKHYIQWIKRHTSDASP